MTKKSISGLIAASAAFISIAAVPLSASAATPEEAAAVARSYGVSEETIQQCWNEYYANPELYPPEEIDNLLAQFIAQMESVSTTVPYNPDAKPPVVTTAADSKPDKDDKPSTQITLTTPDGKTFTRISADDFMAMSYEDKQTYLSTFTPEQQAVIMENLTPEEYKNLLKQMPTDNKLEVIDGITDIANGFGLNVNVDEITDENVVLSIKNKDGELVAVSSAKETVENTGYDRRGIFAGAAALILAGAAGMFVLVKKCFKSENGV